MALIARPHRVGLVAPMSLMASSIVPVHANAVAACSSIRRLSGVTARNAMARSSGRLCAMRSAGSVPSGRVA
jgi:hypothetical protein